MRLIESNHWLMCALGQVSSPLWATDDPSGSNLLSNATTLVGQELGLEGRSWICRKDQDARSG